MKLKSTQLKEHTVSENGLPAFESPCIFLGETENSIKYTIGNSKVFYLNKINFENQGRKVLFMTKSKRTILITDSTVSDLDCIKMLLEDQLQRQEREVLFTNHLLNLTAKGYLKIAE